MAHAVVGMARLRIGRHGLLLLLALFLLLGFEDVAIWLRTGALPAVEFFVALLLVVATAAVAIREAVRHPPPRR